VNRGLIRWIGVSNIITQNLYSAAQKPEGQITEARIYLKSLRKLPRILSIANFLV
jgi:hypothetical protein